MDISGISVDESPYSAAAQSAQGKNNLDKEAFLQLLVSQLKNQDPLEPTPNVRVALHRSPDHFGTVILDHGHDCALVDA